MLIDIFWNYLCFYLTRINFICFTLTTGSFLCHSITVWACRTLSPLALIMLQISGMIYWYIWHSSIIYNYYSYSLHILCLHICFMSWEKIKNIDIIHTENYWWSLHVSYTPRIIHMIVCYLIWEAIKNYHINA